MKACLFFVAGSVRRRGGRIEIAQLGGLGRQMPWSMAAFTVAALSMIGIPPTAGFFSKWYLLLGALEVSNPWFVAVVLVSSLMNAVYFFRILENLYAKPSAKETGVTVQDAPTAMLVPTVILALALLALGFGNSIIVTQVLNPIAGGFYRR
jgi:multicomponent Na+:H+ antiporter subunit D